MWLPATWSKCIQKRLSDSSIKERLYNRQNTNNSIPENSDTTTIFLLSYETLYTTCHNRMLSRIYAVISIADFQDSQIWSGDSDLRFHSLGTKCRRKKQLLHPTAQLVLSLFPVPAVRHYYRISWLGHFCQFAEVRRRCDPLIFMQFFDYGNLIKK